MTTVKRANCRSSDHKEKHFSHLFDVVFMGDDVH